MKPASTPDTQLFEDGVKGSEEVTGQTPDSVTSDGGYQSAGNQEFADGKGIKAVYTGFQGREGAYDLELSPDGQSLEVTKRATGEKLPASRTKGGSWRVEDTKDGKKHVRYIRPESIAAAMRRKAQENIPKRERWLRNNVEATMFQLTFHTRNNKTRYRGMMKQKIFALSRCLWVNHVRLALFEQRMAS